MGAAALPPELCASLGRPRQPQPSALTRRSGLLQVASAGLAVAGGRPVLAEASAKISTQWSASEGTSFLSVFNEDSYGAMRDDTRRTPAFIKAIRQRVAGKEGKLTMLDIGTGPFALFALVAARAGARKVWAVEANPEAAARAKDYVEKQEDIPEGVVEVIEGFTTAVSLPEKVDLVCAEIVGSLASEENMLTTIRDAQERLVKKPEDPASWIPVSVQTFAAPVSYALHNMLAPPRYEQLKGKPLRLNCRDRTLQLLSDPQVLEDIKFSDKLPQPGRWQSTKPFLWTVSGDRLAENTKSYFAALTKEENVKEEEAQELAKSTADSFSGLAFWPRLVLDQEGELVVESRGPKGEHQKSHWNTLVSLMSPTPLPVKPGDEIRVSEAADIAREVLTPVQYTLQGEIIPVAA